MWDDRQAESSWHTAPNPDQGGSPVEKVVAKWLPGRLGPHTIDLSLGDRLGEGAFAGPRQRSTTMQAVVAAAIVPMVAVTVWLALTSDHLEFPVASALYWS